MERETFFAKQKIKIRKRSVKKAYFLGEGKQKRGGMVFNMRKELIICVVIVVVIIIGNILTQGYTKDVVTYMNGTLENLKEDLLQEEVDTEKVAGKITNIREEWEKRYQKLAYFIEHDELEKVETELTSLQANIETKEYKQGVPDLQKCIFILDHIKDKFSLQIKNIF